MICPYRSRAHDHRGTGHAGNSRRIDQKLRHSRKLRPRIVRHVADLPNWKWNVGIDLIHESQRKPDDVNLIRHFYRRPDSAQGDGKLAMALGYPFEREQSHVGPGGPFDTLCGRHLVDAGWRPPKRPIPRVTRRSGLVRHRPGEVPGD